MSATNLTLVIFCTLEFEALHCWASIPDDSPSQFLKYPHRHLFKITVYSEVSHTDRDLEFIHLKHRVQKFLKEEFTDFSVDSDIPFIKSMSCEDLALHLLEKLNLNKVKVSEDGENGAIVFKSSK